MKLRYGNNELELVKSDDTVALAPRHGQKDRALHAFAGSEDLHTQLGSFDLARVSHGHDMEKSLDRARHNSAVAVGSHVYHIEGSTVPLVPNGKLFLVFKATSTIDERNTLLTEHHLEPLEARDEHGLIVRVTSGSLNPLKTAEALQQLESVEIAEPDLAIPGRLFAVPTDPRLADQWHLRNTGFHHKRREGFRQGADARVIDAWERAETLGSPSVTVAVIDDGFDLDHADLSGPGKIISPWDFQRGNDQPLPASDSWRHELGDWHGTACAGVAVGTANGVGMLGSAPGCRLMPIRWGNSVSDEQLELWFQHALDHDAAVISCSWGVAVSNYPLSTRKDAMLRKCAEKGRNGRGTVVCFAAGNEDRDINDPSAGWVNGFATHGDVIAVAACTSLDQRSSYSNYGDEISICAPSSGAGGWPITTADVSGTYLNAWGQLRERGYSPGDITHTFGGTSSACPLVAGICALLLSLDPSLESQEVKDILQRTARKMGDLASYHQRHSKYHGYGCINAHAAVEDLLQTMSTR